MKRLLFFLSFITAALTDYSQAQRFTIDSASLKLHAETEKAAHDRLLNSNNRDNSVASENFDIHYYRCEWVIDPFTRYISGKITSFFTIVQATGNIIFDLSDTLTVDSIIYKGQPILYQRIANDGLVLQFPGLLNKGLEDSVAIYYRGVPKIKKSFQAFSQFMHNGTPVISTLSEPYGAKEWWPCKNGLTDKTDSIDIIITSPPSFKGIANGILISDTTNGGNRSLHYRHRYPIASYLIGITVSNYETVADSIQIGNKTIPVICNYYPEFIYDFQGANYYAKLCLVKFSQLFGVYPFINEQYSQTQWSNGGGMEHQTNSFIRTADPQLIAHELGHHWFGDMVTCGSWQDVWLNEGFADYIQYIFVENFDSTIKLIHLRAHMNLALSDSAGSVFVTDTTNPSRIFNGPHSYYKGGYVLHMLRGMLGDSIFFKGLKKYINDPLVKYKFATTADLERNLESAGNTDLRSFFKKWIYGEGYPNYSGSWYQNNNNWANVQIKQTTTHASVSFYEMPVQLRFKNNDRDTVITVNHSFSGQTFWINPGFKADSMFIDPYLWILAKERTVIKQTAAVTTPNDLLFYPNPAPEVLTISLKNPLSQKISIGLYNAGGQLLRQSEVMLPGRDELIAVPTSLLPHGVYIIKVTGNKNILAVKKFVR